MLAAPYASSAQTSIYVKVLNENKEEIGLRETVEEEGEYYEEHDNSAHLSQITPLYLMRLYLPQWHSQSLVGPKIFSQNKPSFSGFCVL